MSVHVLSVVGSPHGSGSTATATQAVLAGAVAAGARTESLDLSSEDLDAVVDRVDKADGVALPRRYTARRTRPCSPRCSKRIPRGAVGETPAPLAGKAALVLLTGASYHHFLATERLRAPLASFFAVQTLSPGLYFTPASYTPDPHTPHRVLNEESRALAEFMVGPWSSWPQRSAPALHVPAHAPDLSPFCIWTGRPRGCTDDAAHHHRD